jgi:hypothetical protein
MTAPRPIFRLRLRPEPHIEPIRALRAALKRLLRDFGLRCVSVEQESPQKPASAGPVP